MLGGEGGVVVVAVATLQHEGGVGGLRESIAALSSAVAGCGGAGMGVGPPRTPHPTPTLWTFGLCTMIQAGTRRPHCTRRSGILFFTFPATKFLKNIGWGEGAVHLEIVPGHS